MARQVVTGDLYETLTGQIFELGRQLRQPNGYPFNPLRLKDHLQALIEGKFTLPETYNVKLRAALLGGADTSQIARALRDKGMWVDDYIAQANFPLYPADKKVAKIEIVDPGCSFSEQEGLRLLKERGLERPTYEHALRFAEQYGMVWSNEKPFVVFLHVPWRDPRGQRRIICANREPHDSGLDLLHVANELDARFDARCVLAGVHPDGD